MKCNEVLIPASLPYLRGYTHAGCLRVTKVIESICFNGRLFCLVRCSDCNGEEAQGSSIRVFTPRDTNHAWDLAFPMVIVPHPDQFVGMPRFLREDCTLSIVDSAGGGIAPIRLA